MICRPSFVHLAGLIFACSLAGCEQPEVNLSAIEKARIELINGNGLSARIHLDRALAQGKTRRDLAVLFAEAALLDGDLETARDWLGPGEFSDETQAEGFRLLGRLERIEGNLAAARRALDRSYRADPENAALWVEIGRLRYRAGEQFEAIEASDHAIALDPNSGEALQFRGQLARDVQGMETGARVLRKAIERQPSSVALRIEYAATLGDAGRAKEALRVMRADGGRATSAPSGLFVQAVIAARGRNFSLSRDLLARSGLAQNGPASAQLLSAIIDLEEENYASAAQTLDRLASAQPDNRRIRNLLAYALSRSGGEQELINRFASYATGTVSSTYLRMMVGRAYEALGERERAAIFLDLAATRKASLTVLPGTRPVGTMLISDPEGAIETRDYIRSAIAVREPVAGIRRAREFAKRLPGSADALAILGDAELAQGNKRAARAAYQRSATVRQPWPLMLRLIGAQENRGDAIRLLEAFAYEHPMNGEASAMLADALAAQGDWERSVQLLDHAIGVGMARVSWVLAARSVGARQLGDSETALSFALAAHDLQPMNPLAISALIAALPADENATRQELEAKLRSLTAS